MRGEIGRPKRTREKKPANERRRGKRHREEEDRRKKRTFSCTRLFSELQSPPIAQQRDSLLAKAHHFVFPAYATGKYKNTSVRKQYGRDVSAGASLGLPAFHKSALHFLVNDLLLRHQWPQLAGVLCVLLRALLAERDWNPHYTQYFWAAMEVTRQLEGLEGNDFKFRRIYQILHDKQPKGPWSRNKVEAGTVRLELALYLMNEKHFEDANLASEPFMDIPPYRDHPLANLVHGLIHYYQWFELVKQGVDQESTRVGGHVKMEDFSEGVGENDGVFSDDRAYKDNFSNEEYTFRLDDDLVSEDTSTFNAKNNEGNGFKSSKVMRREAVPPNVKEETAWNFYDDAEEDNEKSYMKKARVVYTTDLDKMLFPFTLPRHYVGKRYSIPMGTAMLKNSYNTAVKHLRDALSLDRHSTSALLPLVQLMLAGDDVDGAYAEIEKCSQKFSDYDTFRIKCKFLESLSPENNEMLINAYEEVLEKDPSSVHPLERLINMHKTGEYRTDALFQLLGLHLDACQGSILIWRKLALCFQRLKEAESELAKKTAEINKDSALEEDVSEVDFLQQQSVQETWKLRERWWLVKHFRIGCMEEEVNANGIQWLVFKAACSAHIYGSYSRYVLEAEKHLQMLGYYSHMEKLQRHKGNSFDLLARFMNFRDAQDTE